ncbi:MAG TPA: TIM44-like domain-containing protein, partial [Verrucomicrobiae bacterium]|nr:TIM44-like domain-containing protein [Verrucomicrobiae bacterium]
MKKLAATATVAVALSCLTVSGTLSDAFARAGGGMTSGSRGSRMTAPSRSYSPSYNPAPYQSPSPMQAPAPQPAGGGFLRRMAGGMLGGFLGGMLFRGLGFAGPGMGGGIGLFEILLLAGIAFFIFRMVQRRRSESAQDSYSYGTTVPFPEQPQQPAWQPQPTPEQSVEGGIAHIRSMDPTFSPEKFGDTAMDIFFRIQGSWMNRDLSPVRELLTEEMRGILQGQVDELRRVKMVNHLENVAVRRVDIVEAWQERGQDFITVGFRASLLDYTTD